MPKPTRPAREKDLPAALADEIEGYLASIRPDMSVTIHDYGPDEPPPSVIASIESLTELYSRSLVMGFCAGCRSNYPGEWPLEDDEVMRPGWVVATDDDCPAFLLCRGCDAKSEPLERG